MNSYSDKKKLKNNSNSKNQPEEIDFFESLSLKSFLKGLTKSQFFICLFVVVMPLLFCKWNDQSPFEMIKAYFSALFIATILMVKIGFQLFKKEIQIKYNIWVFSVLFYLVIYLVSFSQAENYYQSFWGVLNLPAGSVMTILTFSFLSIISVQFFSSASSLKKLSFSFVILALAMSVYGIIQHFGYDPINWWVYDLMHVRALSTIGQSVGYGTVLGCILPLIFVFLISTKKTASFVFFVVAWFIVNLGILYSGSRFPIFGYWLTMLFFLGFIYIFRNKFKDLDIKKIALSYALIGLTTLIYFVEPGENAITKRLASEALKSAYSTRFLVWRTSFDIWKQNPILGVGPENFGEAFNRIQTVEQNYGESWNLIWHKAHNEFIHYLVTTGLLGILAYFFLIILMFYPVFKILKKPDWSTNELFSVALLGGFGFLLVTHLTAFSFIPTLLIFFIYPAMSFGFLKLYKEKFLINPLYLIQSSKIFNTTRALSLALVVGAGFFVIAKVYGVWTADIEYNESRRQLVSYGQFEISKEFLEDALAKNPSNAEYLCFKADVYYNLFVRTFKENPGSNNSVVEQKRQAYFKETIDASDACVNQDDRKSDLWRARGTLFLSLSQFAPQIIEGSLAAFRKAIEVYPNNPANYLSLSSVFKKKNRSDLAIEALKTGLSKRKDMLPIYIELLKIYYEEKKKFEIVELVNSIRALDIKNSEFYPQLPILIRLAESQGDQTTAQQLRSL